MNYRKLYQKKLGVVLPKGFDVHHIDGNRNNNDISNLLALPKKLHQEYHIFMPRFNTIEYNLPSGFYGLNCFDNQIEDLYKFHTIYTECLKWYYYKLHLIDSSIKNIYNLSY